CFLSTGPASTELYTLSLHDALPISTDLVLRVTEMLRQHGVVNKFVEFFGPGLDNMPVANRATIANMAPEYGATIGFFPVDEKTRSEEHTSELQSRENLVCRLLLEKK